MDCSSNRVILFIPLVWNVAVSFNIWADSHDLSTMEGKAVVNWKEEQEETAMDVIPNNGVCVCFHVPMSSLGYQQ